ncbi:MAG TPA: nitroreductase family protein [Syntrophales bacterium]|nr:nitroreductase family protein [Syntrophales bacterium]
MENRFKEIIHYATLAPSGHNTQPWTFSIRNNSIRIYPDYSRRLPVVDPDDHALFISLGCALENLIIAANRMGYGAQVECLPPDEEKGCIRVTLNEEEVECDTDLFDAIPNRQATRSKYDNRPIPAEDLEKLRQAGKQDRVSFVVFTEEKEIDPIIEFVKEGNVLQFRNKAFVNELIEWIRFRKKDALTYRDGLNPASMGLPFVPTWMGRFILNTFATPEGEAKKCEKLIRESSGLALFIAESDDRESWINVGRSFERTVLKATALNIKHAHMNMPCEEVAIREKLQKHLGLKNGHSLLLLRIGYSDPMPKSYRRPLKDVLIES